MNWIAHVDLMHVLVGVLMGLPIVVMLLPVLARAIW